MAIGVQQKALIDKWYSPPGGSYRLDIYCSTRYLNTRETGRGYPVMMAIVHIPSGDIESRFEVARCQTESTGEKKVKEIQEYIEGLDKSHEVSQ